MNQIVEPESEFSISDLGRVVRQGERWEAFSGDGLPLGLFGRPKTAIEAIFYHNERKCVGCDG